MRFARPALLTAAALVAAPGAAQASCVAPPTGDALLASASKATTVFVGTAQANPGVPGSLFSPVTFAVDGWLAGERTGATVSVDNGFRWVAEGGAYVSNSVALALNAGEQWMLDASAGADGVLRVTQCGPLTRRVDLAHPRRVRVKAGAPYTPLPVDFAGRVAVSDTRLAAVDLNAAPIPRTTTRIAGRHVEAMRVIRAGKPRAAKRVSPTAWSVGTLRKGDRLIWLDDRGLWGGTAR